MGRWYTVLQGDYLSKIAHQNGFTDWATIYRHPNNADFRTLRPDPNLIMPGDRLFIPDRGKKQVSCAPKQQHQFRLRAKPPSTLHLRLEGPGGAPLKNAPYELLVDGRTMTGTTDGSGVLEREMPHAAMDAMLRIAGLQFSLKIGSLDPLGASDKDGVSGVKGRLRNLGFDAGDINDRLDDKAREAIRAYERARGLPETGEVSNALKSDLSQRHGC